MYQNFPVRKECHCVGMNGRNLDNPIQWYRLGKYRHTTFCIYFKNSILSTEVVYRHSWLPTPRTFERSCVLVAIRPRSFPFLFFAKYYDIEWLLLCIGYKRIWYWVYQTQAGIVGSKAQCSKMAVPSVQTLLCTFTSILFFAKTYDIEWQMCE